VKIVRSIRKMQLLSRDARLRRKSIGFVPTMGALHAGHLSLIRRARLDSDIVTVSIFVNPTQFGPHEDFKKYPRMLSRDAALCRKEGVDFIFYPSAAAMYPKGDKTFVTVEDLSSKLCGLFRPGHFKGVTTVVAKFFNIINPDVAYFGQKDAQQAIIIKQMARDLHMPVSIRVLPTVREKDGLAMSSRNLYLSEAERRGAVVLSQAIREARQMIQKGVRNPRLVIAKMKALIRKKGNTRVDYVSIVDICGLNPVQRIRGKVLIALAVWMGKTRLIDNSTVEVPYA